jgi:DNA-binding CsgD family transcriptional regulator/PAS domain-containing protein
MANPLQNLSSVEVEILFTIIEKLSRVQDRDALRISIADDLLCLLRSDFLASFTWNEKLQIFENDVFLNMSPENISRYHSYYHFCDPITPLLQTSRKATLVCEVMPQRALEKTEFFNDFLMRDGLHHGINVYAYDGDLNIGDLRIWRGKERPEFGTRESVLLDTILPYFRNALRNARILAYPCGRSETWERLLEASGIALFLFDLSGRLVYRNERAGRVEENLPQAQYSSFFATVRSLASMDLSRTQWGPFSLSVTDLLPPDEKIRYRAVIARPLHTGTLDRDFLMARFGLSRREADISLLLMKGLTDREIAGVLGVAFSTIRTHLKHIFDKLDVSTRSELIFSLLEDLVEINF